MRLEKRLLVRTSSYTVQLREREREREGGREGEREREREGEGGRERGRGRGEGGNEHLKHVTKINVFRGSQYSCALSSRVLQAGLEHRY